ncbi:MAG: glycosyltransferase [Acidobacteriota bacterium]
MSPHRGSLASAHLSAIVPTLGKSPWLRACLEALRADGGKDLEIVLVAPADLDLDDAGEAADLRLDAPAPGGFAAATNAGIAASSGELVATINDDALIQPGWCAELTAGLAADPQAGAAQGANLQLRQPHLVDGLGLEWNRWWQAVQIGHGEIFEAGLPARRVFGVSATVALYRRRALEQAKSDLGQVFDERLHSYYEDAELAGRLRRAGWRALSVPAARALHAGSTTAGGSVQQWSWIYGNRWLAVAQLLGHDFSAARSRLLLRDLRDLLRHPRRLRGALAGWRRARRLLAEFRHDGEALLPPH